MGLDDLVFKTVTQIVKHKIVQKTPFNYKFLVVISNLNDIR